MSPTTNYQIRQAGRRWLLCYQGRLVGIYFAECDAIRGQLQHLNCNRSTKAMKITVLYKREHTIEFDTEMVGELVEQLKSDGLVGKPNKEELITALQSMLAENSEALFPELEDFLQEMKITNIEGELPEIEEDAE